MGTYKTIELAGNLYIHADQLVAGFTTNGHHVRGSWHYRDGGDAVDWDSGTTPATAAALKAAGRTPYDALSAMAGYFYERSSMIVELFSTNKGKRSGHYVKNGVRRSYLWALVRGLATFSESQDHIHIAVATQDNADRLLTDCVQAALGLTRDGSKGPITTKAIKDVQRAAGITVDGIVGTATVKAIRAHCGWKEIV